MNGKHELLGRKLQLEVRAATERTAPVGEQPARYALLAEVVLALRAAERLPKRLHTDAALEVEL